MAHNKQTPGVSELKLTDFEDDKSPLAIFSKKMPDNLITGGSEHSFGPFNSLEHNSSHCTFLVPSFSQEYINLVSPRLRGTLEVEKLDNGNWVKTVEEDDFSICNLGIQLKYLNTIEIRL